MSAKPNTPQPSTPSDSAEPDFAQIERMLKAQLDQADKNPRDVLWQLARLYQATKRPDQALQCLRRILASESDLEVKETFGDATRIRECAIFKPRSQLLRSGYSTCRRCGG
jgi:thioredoxin-like negative regulator of GroEL